MGDQAEAITWAEYGIRICEDDPWCEDLELNLRSWMVQQFSHQDNHPVLDTRVIVRRFFGNLIWTPEETVAIAQEAWERRDRELFMQQRRIKQALIRLRGIEQELPQDEQVRLRDWFSAQHALK